VDGGTGGMFTTWYSRLALLEARNGSFPVSIWYISTPSE
jgi:hypothetical protein